MHRTSLASPPLPRRLHGLVLLLGWLLALAGPLVDQAAAGRIHRATSAGLSMTVDARWTPGPAYRHVQIKFAPTAPTGVDRTLTVEFLTRKTVDRNADHFDQRVAQDVDIPAGSGPVVMDMAIPQCMGGYYQIVVVENRRVIKGLTQPWTPDGENLWTFNNDMAGVVVEQIPRMLIVGPKLPDMKNMRQPLLDLVTSVQPSMAEMALAAKDQEWPIAQFRPLEELPGRWIDYSNFDLLILSLDEFRQLSTRNPPAREAIVRWAEAGGNLLVYGLGSDWQTLPELERLAGLASPGDSSDSEAAKRRWQTPDPERVVAAIQDAAAARLGVNDGVGVGAVAMPATASATRAVPNPLRSGSTWAPGGPPSQLQDQEWRIPLPDDPSAVQLLAGMTIALEGKPPQAFHTTAARLALPSGPPHFLYRRLGMGMLVALAPEDPFVGTPIQWQWLYNVVGPDRLFWARRHGVSMLAPNPGYWDFLIPGVGLPPVNAFRALISLFVVVIGPVNYFLLRHWRRLHLLVLTVPLTAAVITGLLLAYAFVADGMGNRVRARSFTWLDQRRGEAVCWTRLSYYAGLSPPRGLIFSADTVVLPLDATPPRVFDTGSPIDRDMLWEGHQRLARGWLPARTPTQLITMAARPSHRGLRITPDAQDAKKIQVQNGLETRLRQVLVRTEGNRYYWAEDVAAGKTATATAIELRDATEKMRQTAAARRPEAPSDINAQAIHYQSIRTYGTDWSIRSMVGEDNDASDDSLLEHWLGMLDPRENHDPPSLEAKSYLGIVDASPEVELGLPDASEEASSHVILGTW